MNAIEAITAEIESRKRTGHEPIGIAALELALADAEFVKFNDSPVKYKALLDARARLLEVLRK